MTNAYEKLKSDLKKEGKSMEQFEKEYNEKKGKNDAEYFEDYLEELKEMRYEFQQQKISSWQLDHPNIIDHDYDPGYTGYIVQCACPDSEIFWVKARKDNCRTSHCINGERRFCIFVKNKRDDYSSVTCGEPRIENPNILTKSTYLDEDCES